MSDGDLQLALREWRSHITSIPAAVATLGIGTVLGLLGPFNTEALLPLLQRLVYWCALVTLTYDVGSLVNAVLGVWMRGQSRIALLVATTLGVGIAVTIVVFAINYVVFSHIPAADEIVAFLATTFAICAIVNGALHYFFPRMEKQGPAPVDAPPARKTAPLLDRLPLDKRAALVAISVEDHYVRIQTTKGEDMVLLRLSDAIREVGDTNGAQVHRSHWIAFDQVTSAKRVADRAVLTMTNGSEIPVSRANLPKIKEAGLLPK